MRRRGDKKGLRKRRKGEKRGRGRKKRREKRMEGGKEGRIGEGRQKEEEQESANIFWSICCWAVETAKSNPSDTPPLRSPHLLILQRESINWEANSNL